jgi:hypothetical protein
MPTKQWLQNFFFHFMGVSGWLVIAAVMLGAYMMFPSDWGHRAFMLQAVIIVAIWLVAKWWDSGKLCGMVSRHR